MYFTDDTTHNTMTRFDGLFNGRILDKNLRFVGEIIEYDSVLPGHVVVHFDKLIRDKFNLPYDEFYNTVEEAIERVRNASYDI